MMASNFWTQSNSIDDVDLVTDDMFSTPAIEQLMDSLNNASNEQGSELYFLLAVSDEETFMLNPNDQFGGYPNNWLMRGMYQGPMRGKHVIYLEFRPLGYEYRIEDLNPSELVGKISRTINHEIVHYKQLKKQAAAKGISDEEAWEQLLKDPKQIQQDTKGGTSRPYHHYIGLHNEIDAYSYEAAEELLDKYSLNQALDLLRYRKAELTDVLQKYIDSLTNVSPKKLDKFFSRVYANVMRMSEEIMTTKNNSYNLSEGLKYHLKHRTGVDKNIHRPGSKEFFRLFREVRALSKAGLYNLNEVEEELINNSDIGEYGYYEGKKVPLDYPSLIDDDIDEAKYKGRKVKLGKKGARRIGGGRARVYVRDPKTGKIKKVEFGSSLPDAMGDSKKAKQRRKSFGDRHRCADKKDKTKPDYWSCRLTKLFGRNIPGWW